ncbi:hypothetical protein DVH26_12830 [Paenibacillus sp. H1-7]|uniref:hypothetical protein n=1 Tax=Paenibacillus sp. H1-7 TaxID=2282849 RepID=UPI001EF77599|nr:hypothetical protein [Paenibacillus sp. H1-7]ULL15244.1 hypothetical protein DVH26_12830 [Paenibacillus sp. H1-7]
MARKMLQLLLICSLGFVTVAGCSGGGDGPVKPDAAKTPEGGIQPAKMPIRWYSQGYQTKIDVASHDVVTPYIQNKFNIEFTDMYVNNDQPLKERLNQWIATKNLPDVVMMDKAGASYAISTGQFADLTEFIKDMPNLKKWFPEQYWSRFTNDGRNYQIPTPLVNTNSNDPKYADDPYNSGKRLTSLYVREDLLAKAGYKFKPLKEIQKETVDKGKKPTLEDFAIEPAIKTPEDFYQLLKKMKELNVSANGKPLIPISFPIWAQFHFGSMFDFGHWTLDKDGTVDGFLGSKDAKKYHEFMNRLYQEGLLDKDFIIQKDDQLQTKAATGQLGVILAVLNLDAVRQSLLNIDPSMELRAIPWPKENPDKGYYDIYEGSFWRLLIRKDFPDIKRLIQYLDWTLSDEALDLMSWGPENAGIWKMQDGKKVFVDPQVESDMLTGKLGGKGADYYGLFSRQFYSKASYFGLGWYLVRDYNPKSPLRSYPAKYDLYVMNSGMVANKSYNVSGTASYGDGSKEAEAASNTYWTFTTLDVAKLLTPKTKEEFDKNWNAIITKYMKDTNYEQASKNMVKWFKDNPPAKQ